MGGKTRNLIRGNADIAASSVCADFVAKVPD
jgi:hypothetical protein